jgi:elongator complex protein 1
MSLRDAELKSTPIDVAVSPTGRLIAVLRTTGIDLIRWKFAKNRLVSGPEVISDITKLDPGQYFRQISFVDDETLGIVCDHKGDSVLQIISIQSSGPALLKSRVELCKGAFMMRFGAVPELKSLFYEDSNAKVHLYDTESLTASCTARLPATCPWLEVSLLGSKVINGQSN